MVKLIRSKATPSDITEMLSALESYIKIAVDLKLGVLAGGGVMHADCERALLDAGSRQADVWGSDWYPQDKRVEFGSLINIRPKQNNRSMEVQDPALRRQIESVVRKLLEP